MRLFLLSLVCMTLFATNTLFCRTALIAYASGPVIYTFIRGSSALLMLLLLVVLLSKAQTKPLKEVVGHGSMLGGLSLFSYMLFFSLAFQNIPAAAGTLIINFSVQLAMIGWGLIHGLRLSRLEKTGYLIASMGLVLLVSSKLSVPSSLHAALIAISGFSWGVYCLCGKDGVDPLLTTAGNFLRMLPYLALCGIYALFFEETPDAHAVVSALVAGMGATAAGYALWYRILPRFTLTFSSIMQLSVPVIAAFLAIPFLGEKLNLTLVSASALILGGIALAFLAKRQA